MADILRLPPTVLASILRPLIIAQFPLTTIRAVRTSLGITNPVRELTKIYHAVKAQIGKVEALKAARADRVIDPSLFVPAITSLSRKFLYVVNVFVRDPATNETYIQNVGLLSSRRLTKKTAIQQAIDRLLNPPPGALKYAIEETDILDAELESAVDRDL